MASHFEFHPNVLCLFFVVSCIGCIANCISVFKVYKSFNTRKVIYLILLTDGIVQSLMMGVSATSSLAFLAKSNSLDFNYKLGCHFLAGSGYTGNFISPFFVSLISSIRYYMTRHGDLKSLNKPIRIGVSVGTGIKLVFFFALMLYSYNGGFISGVIALCIHGPSFQFNPNPALMAIVFLWNKVEIGAAIVLDIMTYNHIKRRVAPAQNEFRNRELLEIPLRASMLSSGLAVSMLIVGGIATLLFIDKTLPPILLFTFSLIVMSVRNPAMVSFTFKVNLHNQAITQQELREVRRQEEINFAIKERNKRRNVFTIS